MMKLILATVALVSIVSAYLDDDRFSRENQRFERYIAHAKQARRS